MPKTDPKLPRGVAALIPLAEDVSTAPPFAIKGRNATSAFTRIPISRAWLTTSRRDGGASLVAARRISGRPRPSASQIRSSRRAWRVGWDLAEGGRASGGVALDPGLLTFFEVTVLGFWTLQAASDHADAPGASLDSAANRVVEAADLLLLGRSSEMPQPEEFLVDLLARRFDTTFRKSDLTREILDDDGDDTWRVARWLVYPEHWTSARDFATRSATFTLSFSRRSRPTVPDGPTSWGLSHLIPSKKSETPIASDPRPSIPTRAEALRNSCEFGRRMKPAWRHVAALADY